MNWPAAICSRIGVRWGAEPKEPGGEPYPLGLLSEAEIVIENRGIYEWPPMLSPRIGDLQAVPEMVTGVLMDALSEGGVWLNESLFESPGTAIAALNQLISAAPLVGRPPGELMAAISGQVGTRCGLSRPALTPT